VDHLVASVCQAVAREFDAVAAIAVTLVPTHFVRPLFTSFTVLPPRTIPHAGEDASTVPEPQGRVGGAVGG